MKIDRLLGILAALLRRDKVTAPFLAEKFEVSRRTISRDIETLCMAGIPIVTEQGRNGGISIAPGYTFSRQLFTEEELHAILSGIRGIDSVSPAPHRAVLEEKLSPSERGSSPLLIDLSSHYHDSLTEKISLFRRAIDSSLLVTFRYYSEKGESARTVEPYYVVFQWGDWYLLAWCTERKDFRLFKLSRLWEPRLTSTGFSPRRVPEEKLDFEQTWQENYRLEAVFDPEVKYRLIEEYGPGCFSAEPDGRLRFSVDFTFYSSMLSWVLSFGSSVQVLSPPKLREDLKKQGEFFLSHYAKQDS